MTKQIETPVKIERFTATRQCFGHGEYGFVITVSVDQLSGYDNMDEKKVRAVVDALNKQLTQS